MPFCTTCGKEFARRCIENGKNYNIGGRKRCFSCSPSRRENYRKCADGRIHANGKAYTPKNKECITLSLYRKGLERKAEILQKSGNKCQHCGYDKCKRALAFHHRDSTSKKFGLSINNLWAKQWNDILIELAKCDLLCSNCHAEIEEELTKRKGPTIAERVNIKYGTNFE